MKKLLDLAGGLVVALMVIGMTPGGWAQDAPPKPSAAPAPQIASPAAGNPAAGAPAQGSVSGAAPFTIKATSRLVVLDVVVEDKKGNVIRGLTRDNFHVTESGDAQAIQNFDTTGKFAVSPTASVESTADLDRVAPRAPVDILLLDEFNTHFEDMAFARYSLKKFLNRQPGRLDTPTMLVSVSLSKFEVLRDYTQNKDEILAALDHHFAAYPWQATQGAWVGERYATAFESLRRVAQAQVGHLGQKNMVWIGRGFPPFDLRVNLDTTTRLRNIVQETVNELRDARVTLYTIDPAGLQVTNTYSSLGDYDDPFGGNYEFSKLAMATGGRALYGRNDVDAEIATAIRDGDSTYTMTYRPTTTTDNAAKFRKIVVTVDRPDAVIYTRQGYYPRRGPGRVDATKPSRRLVADLVAADTSTMVYDGVPLVLENTAEKPDEYTIQVPARSLGWSAATDTEPRHAEVILMVSSYDKKGKEIKRVAMVNKASAPKTVSPTGRIERGMSLTYKLEPDPKVVRVRFTVRVTASGRIGTADVVPGQVVPATTAAAPPA